MDAFLAIAPEQGSHSSDEVERLWRRTTSKHIRQREGCRGYDDGLYRKSASNQNHYQDVAHEDGGIS
jgi:hypothetical protein